MNPLNNSIKFGTDGWRAVISEDFTFANVRKVAQAVAEQVIFIKNVFIGVPNNLRLANATNKSTVRINIVPQNAFHPIFPSPV